MAVAGGRAGKLPPGTGGGGGGPGTFGIGGGGGGGGGGGMLRVGRCRIGATGCSKMECLMETPR